MDFLADWRKRFRHWYAERSRQHQPDFRVARYITSKRLRWKEGGFALKPAAFLPAMSGAGRLELSVFRTDGLSEGEIWALAVRHVVPLGRSLHGRGDLHARQVALTHPPLSLDMDEAPPRHGNILDWPTDIDEQLALAQELAELAQHHPPPANP